MGVLGDYLVCRSASVRGPRPLQPNLKGAQINSVQNDRFGNNRQPTFSNVAIQFLEFLSKRRKILVDIMQRGLPVDRVGLRQAVGDGGEFVLDGRNCVRHVFEQLVRC